MDILVFTVIGIVVILISLFLGIRIGEVKALKQAAQIMSQMAEEIGRKADPSYGLTPVESTRDALGDRGSDYQ